MFFNFLHLHREKFRIKIYTTNFPIGRRNLRLLPFNGIFAVAVSHSYVYENKWKLLDGARRGINVVAIESGSRERASFFFQIRNFS